MLWLKSLHFSTNNYKMSFARSNFRTKGYFKKQNQEHYLDK